ncbi:MAG TPA: hypothetical protein VFN24_01405 [Microbacterium sp.]|nr:hypothetical protein [Microbacterium sp.]
MILVDTSVWIDQLHRSDPALIMFLEREDVPRTRDRGLAASLCLSGSHNFLPRSWGRS